ncbi:MAG TPA: hypothetical protein VGS12_15395 [Caulobacteraceae bacterium]|nr:hypothetical protein [Caulobacteraceae bacterium]
MDRAHLTVFVAVMMATGPAAGCLRSSGPAAATAVRADQAAFVAQFNAHDPIATNSHVVDEGFVAMVHGARNVVGKAADLADGRQLLADPNAHLALSNEVIDVAASGDWAVDRSTYAITFTDPKTRAPATEVGNMVTGYKRQSDGAWKMRWQILSDTPRQP